MTIDCSHCGNIIADLETVGPDDEWYTCQEDIEEICREINDKFYFEPIDDYVCYGCQYDNVVHDSAVKRRDRLCAVTFNSNRFESVVAVE